MIDEKGKLFGKINILDLLVLIIAVAALVLVTLKLTSPKDAEIVGNSSYVRFTVKSSAVYPATFETIQRYVNADEGLMDQMMTGSALCTGFVTDVYAIPHETYVQLEDGSIIVTQSTGADDRLDLYWTCEAKVSNPVTNAVGTQEIRAGMGYIVKTTHFEWSGSRILDVEWLEEEDITWLDKIS